MLFRSLLLTAGLILLAINWYFYPLSYLLQLILFAIGLIAVGIPHGGADRLIAMKTASRLNLNFSAQKFTLIYCGQILLFFFFFYCFPHLAILLFLLLSAYHFGETDMTGINHSYAGKLIRLSYGLFILGLILLPNFSSVSKTLIHLNPAGPGAACIQWADQHPQLVLLGMVAAFGISWLGYWLLYKKTVACNRKEILRFLVLVLIVYQLPLLLSFTFYFIFWHSITTLKSMLGYLLEHQSFDKGMVVREIIKNSLIVLFGICFAGYISSLFFRNDNLVLYAIIGLAALTGPHMHVMHSMYHHYAGNEKP
ncbi:beta-carotene 15,15'-dioxygenase, Brp/Blh family [Pedobacter sp. MR2016-24]|uniref:beta-carotene 15,15'-dioxygenase, Brp/Blh family n=1 Tax=Pedobacter sp. MR2016-24 TaxID=2994466 RepID=UPI002245E286|nr:beta-carotene 15,15'-dioxygenase, Brp/Blh family [Pedobacter sp. MR2016-24]MCX2485049.1 beta-carotene 15,15'-dioxygenase, Brp/Blh family [Pedobacter sp. MR2016-24]